LASPRKARTDDWYGIRKEGKKVMIEVETLPLETAVNMPSDEKNPPEIIEEKELKENVLAAISVAAEKSGYNTPEGG